MRRLRTPSFAVLVLMPIVGFVLLACGLVAGKTDALDLAIEQFVSQLDSVPADAIMKAATVIGEYGFVVPVVAIVTITAWVRGNRRAAVILTLDAIACLSTPIVITETAAS